MKQYLTNVGQSWTKYDSVMLFVAITLVLVLVAIVANGFESEKSNPSVPSETWAIVALRYYSSGQWTVHEEISVSSVNSSSYRQVLSAKHAGGPFVELGAFSTSTYDWWLSGDLFSYRDDDMALKGGAWFVVDLMKAAHNEPGATVQQRTRPAHISLACMQLTTFTLSEGVWVQRTPMKFNCPLIWIGG